MASNIESRLMTFRELLAGEEQYVVPIYQRDYSWTTAQVEQLWDDIISTIDLGSNEHFMGAIVVDKSESSKLALIDGQQRMATISILICALRDIAALYGDDELAKVIDSRYLGAINLETRQLEPKLILNENDNVFYRDHILNRKIETDFAKLKKTLGKSSKSLLDAYEYLYGSILNRVKENGNEAFARTLVQLETCINKKLIVIEIAVEDLSNAYLIFETLNDRGLELSVSDLLKNYLFSKAKDNLKDVKRLWDDTNVVLSRQDLTQFIRYYWISRNDMVRNTELYKAVRENVRNPIQALSFAKQLRSAADDYSALNDSNHWMWATYENNALNVGNLIEQLNLFRTTQCYPVLLAAREKLTDDLFPKVLNIVVVISFRYSVICGFNPNRLEAIYNRTALYIRNYNPKSPSTIFEQLDTLYPDDETFKRFFVEKSITSARLARYILSEISNHFSESKEMTTNTDAREVNLEHILPKSFDEPSWALTFTEREHQDYVNRLGNMTLLTTSDNRRLGNVAFEEKCAQVYSKAHLKITRDLNKYPHWSPNNIEKRQQEMAEAAAKIWALNY